MLALDGAGCPAWARAGDGRTPLHAAAEQGWDSMLDLLVRRLDSKARSSLRVLPRVSLHAAAEQGWDSVLDLLVRRLDSKARGASAVS